MRKIVVRLLIVIVSCLVAFGLAEAGYRLLRNDVGAADEGARMFFMDAQRNPFDLESANPEDQLSFLSQIMIEIPAEEKVRKNKLVGTWKPNAKFYICYEGPRQTYFDDHGCVEYKINAVGLRERDDVTFEKPDGEYRVLCIGDSFTLGWGTRFEHTWPILVEQELRMRHPHLRTVNCGCAGGTYADEYAAALENRLYRFQPDMVLATLCLNDLIITNGKLCHYREETLPDHLIPGDQPWWKASKILADLVRDLATPDALDLDPDRDYVRELMELPADHVWYRAKDESPDYYWVAGTPQKALLDMRDWCRDNGVKFAVVVWPLLQGLDGFYPFEDLHRMVSEYCTANQIPCLDLLPTFTGHAPRPLWVSPADMHPNEEAQTLAEPAISAFVEGVMGR